MNSKVGGRAIFKLDTAEGREREGINATREREGGKTSQKNKRGEQMCASLNIIDAITHMKF